MQSHFLHMLAFTALVSTFFAFLAREGTARRIRFALVMASLMLVFSLALAWAMYPIP